MRTVTVLLVLSLGACSSLQQADLPTGERAAEAAAPASPVTSATGTTAGTTDGTSNPTAPPARIDTTSPDSPEALATDLTATERMIRDPTVDLDDALTAGRHLQRLYALLSQHPEWSGTVLALVGEDIAADVADHWEARRALSSLATSTVLATQLPAWRIVQPLPPDELVALYQEAEAATGVEWEILAAINLIETRMGRIVGYSTAGAVGPMQFLPSTWEECCKGDPTVPVDAIRGAAVYLTHRGAPADMARALRGYNNSDHYVTAVTAYARVIARDPMAYRGLWAFEVYFRTSAGVVHLPVGYDQAEPVDVGLWLADHPEELVDATG